MGDSEGEDSDGGEGGEEGEGDTSKAKVENDQVNFYVYFSWRYYFANPEAFVVFIFVIRMTTAPQVQANSKGATIAKGYTECSKHYS